MPSGSAGCGMVIVGQNRIAIVYAWIRTVPVESTAVTVKAYDPLVVGMPEIVGGLERPGGSTPQRKPVAVTVGLYGTPTSPPGSGTGSGTQTVYVRLALQPLASVAVTVPVEQPPGGAPVNTPAVDRPRPVGRSG